MTEYKQTFNFDPELLEKVFAVDDTPFVNEQKVVTVESENGVVDFNFEYIRGGFCLRKNLVRLESVNEKLKRAFPTLQNETVVRLAHKGVFPIQSTAGYLYFNTNDGRMVGTANVDKLAEILTKTPIKPNRRLKRIERIELKYFGLLKLSDETGRASGCP